MNWDGKFVRYAGAALVSAYLIIAAPPGLARSCSELLGVGAIGQKTAKAVDAEFQAFGIRRSGHGFTVTDATGHRQADTLPELLSILGAGIKQAQNNAPLE